MCVPASWAPLLNFAFGPLITQGQVKRGDQIDSYTYLQNEFGTSEKEEFMMTRHTEFPIGHSHIGYQPRHSRIIGLACKRLYSAKTFYKNLCENENEIQV